MAHSNRGYLQGCSQRVGKPQGLVQHAGATNHWALLPPLGLEGQGEG